MPSNAAGAASCPPLRCFIVLLLMAGAPSSEEVYGKKWDRCLENSLRFAGGGAAVGVCSFLISRTFSSGQDCLVLPESYHNNCS